MLNALLRRLVASRAFGDIERGDPVCLEARLDGALDPNVKRHYPGTQFNQSLLLCAVELYRYPCAEVLLDHGANPNQFNEVGSSPFGNVLHHIARVIDDDRLVFTPALPYETHPAMTLAMHMCGAGADRHFRPAGFQEPTALHCAGPSAQSQHFEATIDAWLTTQLARFQAQGLDQNTAKTIVPDRANPRL